MTKREMVEAMLAGKTLTAKYPDSEGYWTEEYGPTFTVCGPSGEVPFGSDCWDFDWTIKPEPKKRLMTRDEVLGFIANTPGLLVKREGNEYQPASYWGYHEGVEYDLYKIVDLQGNTIKGPCRFEVEE
jgi:hypothetical protein